MARLVLPSLPTMPRPQSALTKLILSLPNDLSVAEVLAKAKEAGMPTNEKNVSRVRVDQRKRDAGSAAKPKAASKKAASKATAAKKAATPKKAATAPANAKPAPKEAAKSGGAPVSKKDFVRAQPSTMSAKEVTEKATAAGLTITTEYVYKVRSRLGAKKAPKKPVTAAKTPPITKPNASAKSKPATTKPAPVSGSDDVVAFRRLVLSLGVVRARQLLDELEVGLARLIGGM